MSQGRRKSVFSHRPPRVARAHNLEVDRLEPRELLTINFSIDGNSIVPPLLVSNQAGSYTINLVWNDAGLVSPPGPETAELVTSDGTAKAGVDYQPVDEIVTLGRETPASW